mmetsp:Transcript_11429/g.29167  ORF Transcript_11429/g.29167 Transcript_11429/m.29167 type:complete len:414 (-) Transcript_11429:59-1300(-)
MISRCCMYRSLVTPWISSSAVTALGSSFRSFLSRSARGLRFATSSGRKVRKPILASMPDGLEKPKSRFWSCMNSSAPFRSTPAQTGVNGASGSPASARNAASSFLLAFLRTHSGDWCCRNSEPCPESWNHGKCFLRTTVALTSFPAHCHRCRTPSAAHCTWMIPSITSSARSISAIAAMSAPRARSPSASPSDPSPSEGGRRFPSSALACSAMASGIERRRCTSSTGTVATTSAAAAPTVPSAAWSVETRVCCGSCASSPSALTRAACTHGVVRSAAAAYCPGGSITAVPPTLYTEATIPESRCTSATASAGAAEDSGMITSAPSSKMAESQESHEAAASTRLMGLPGPSAAIAAPRVSTDAILALARRRTTVTSGSSNAEATSLLALIMLCLAHRWEPDPRPGLRGKRLLCV